MLYYLTSGRSYDELRRPFSEQTGFREKSRDRRWLAWQPHSIRIDTMRMAVTIQSAPSALQRWQPQKRRINSSSRNWTTSATQCAISTSAKAGGRWMHRNFVQRPWGGAKPSWDERRGSARGDFFRCSILPGKSPADPAAGPVKVSKGHPGEPLRFAMTKSAMGCVLY